VGNRSKFRRVARENIGAWDRGDGENDDGGSKREEGKGTSRRIAREIVDRQNGGKRAETRY